MFLQQAACTLGSKAGSNIADSQSWREQHGLEIEEEVVVFFGLLNQAFGWSRDTLQFLFAQIFLLFTQLALKRFIYLQANLPSILNILFIELIHCKT